jgi:hypothetical protein
VEAAEMRIVACCRQGRHVEARAYDPAAAEDLALAAARLAALT